MPVAAATQEANISAFIASDVARAGRLARTRESLLVRGARGGSAKCRVASRNGVAFTTMQQQQQHRQLQQQQQQELQLDAHLAPYLSQLDIGEALRSFERLADSILAPKAALTSVISSSSSSHTHASCCDALSSTLADCGHVSSESSASSGFRSASSTPASTLSSASSSSSNANAANKYRRRVRGQQRTLFERAEREQARNARLRAHIQSQLLPPYLELVRLLATNLRSAGDERLARVGKRSVERALKCCGDVLESAANAPQRAELERHLAAFSALS